MLGHGSTTAPKPNSPLPPLNGFERSSTISPHPETPAWGWPCTGQLPLVTNIPSQLPPSHIAPFPTPMWANGNAYGVKLARKVSTPWRYLAKLFATQQLGMAQKEGNLLESDLRRASLLRRWRPWFMLRLSACSAPCPVLPVIKSM